MVELLRSLGHDALTVQEASNAGTSDLEVFAFAIANHRAVLTQNRQDFVKLHQSQPDHAGMIICSDDQNFTQLAEQTHAVISAEDSLQVSSSALCDLLSHPRVEEMILANSNLKCTTSRSFP